MINLKNNRGVTVTLYISDITGYPVISTYEDYNWYQKNAVCDYTTFSDYVDSVTELINKEEVRLNALKTPLSRHELLKRMTQFVLDLGFEYDFRKEA